MSVVILGLLLSLGARPASAAPSCNTWNGGNGNWSDANWTPGPANGFGGANDGISVCITTSDSTVTLDSNPSAASLTLGSTDTLDITNPSQQELQLFGPTISNAGQINITAAMGSNPSLQISASMTLSGAGTITLGNTATGATNSNYAYIGNSDVTTPPTPLLTNQDNTIQGIGVIDLDGMSLDNQASGKINANNDAYAGQVLNVDGFGGAGTLSNEGTMEATSGGTLELESDTVTQSSTAGNITAGASSTVELNHTTIQGGTLNNILGGTLETVEDATLDGSTTSGAVTINGTFAAASAGATGSQTNLLGSIVNNGTMTLTADYGNNNSLQIYADTTLSGKGTVTLGNTALGEANGNYAAIENSNVNASETLENVNNTIQGIGLIDVDVKDLTLTNDAGGIIDANNNTAGQTLTVNGNGGSAATVGVTNTGLMEATGGGELLIENTTVNNFSGVTDGTIEAGAGSTVAIGPSTTINGGIVDGKGTIDATAATGGAFTLSGSTITPGYSATSAPGTLSILLAASTDNFTLSDGDFDELIDGDGPGDNGLLNVDGAVTLTDDTLEINGSLDGVMNGDTFDILNYDGTLDGTFSNAPLDTPFTSDGWTWEITSYNAPGIVLDDPEDPEVILTAEHSNSVTPPTGVPEPSELPMLVIGLLALGAFGLNKKSAKTVR
jgi:hypothetical protein